MKKTVLGLVAVALLAGCGSSGGSAKSESKTCTIDMSGMKLSTTMKAKDDKIKSSSVSVIMPSSLAGGTDLSAITDDEKKALEDNAIASLGIKKGEGVEVSTDFTKEEMKITIDFDLEKGSANALKALGFDEIKDSSLKDFVKEAEDENFTCK